MRGWGAHIICLILERSESRPYHVTAVDTQRATRRERLCGFSRIRMATATSAAATMAAVWAIDSEVSDSHAMHSEST